MTTKIEWVVNPDGTPGYTLNPITGCLKGCSYCYARNLAKGRLKPLYLSNKSCAEEKFPAGFQGLAMFHCGTDPFFPRFWPGKLCDKILEGRKPHGIFLVDMGELFGPWLPLHWTRDTLNLINTHPQNRYYILTKQYDQLEKWSHFFWNAWVGCTVTTQATFIMAGESLLKVKAHLKYLSLEPLQDEIRMSCFDLIGYGIKWLIIGAQTRPFLAPKLDWLQEIVEAADAARIPVFRKNNLALICPNTPLYKSDGMLRQQIPETASISSRPGCANKCSALVPSRATK